ncbi:MAG TPA: hypothetical protein VGB91_08405, partial [Rhizomicrobium sp.]
MLRIERCDILAAPTAIAQVGRRADEKQDETPMRIAALAMLAAFLSAPAAAQADPRQDLIDGMTNCSAIADNA